MSFSGNQYPDYADKVITTRGDIVRGSSTGARERLGIGSNTYVLTSDGTDPSWTAVAAGGANTNRILISGATDSATYTNTALGDVTGTTSATLSNEAGGSAFIYYSYVKETTSIGASVIAIEIDGIDTSILFDQSAPANYIATVSGCAACVATSGQTVQQRVATNSGTLKIYNNSATNGETLTNIIEVW